jgi:sigma-E factor negative regulatory protein RseC
MEVKAVNEAGAKVGDRIVLSFETSSLLKATFLLYIFPILLLIAGAAVGQGIGPRLHLSPSAAAAIIGFAFFFMGVWIMKARGTQIAKKKEYQPKIVKIIKSK